MKSFSNSIPFVLFLFVLGFSSALLPAQQARFQCHTHAPNSAPPPFDPAFAYKTLTPTTVPVALHLFTDAQGNGNGVSVASFREDLDSINVYMNQINLQLHLCAQTIVMDDDHVNPQFDIDQMWFDSLMVPGMVNVFIPNSVNNIAWGGSATRIGGPYTIMDYVLIMGQDMPYGILAHEIGHFLGLYHTFESSFGSELVDGSNCAIAGDLICDTPADPGMSFTEVDSLTCTWNNQGNEFDINGDAYTPSTVNFMSYSAIHCTTEFTPMQLQRIRSTFDTHVAFFDTLCTPLTAIEAPRSPQAVVFPNPSQGRIYLEFAHETWNHSLVLDVRVISLNGSTQTFHLASPSDLRYTLDLADWARGMYFLDFPGLPSQERLKIILQ